MSLRHISLFRLCTCQDDVFPSHESPTSPSSRRTPYKISDIPWWGCAHPIFRACPSHLFGLFACEMSNSRPISISLLLSCLISFSIFDYVLLWVCCIHHDVRECKYAGGKSRRSGGCRWMGVVHLTVLLQNNIVWIRNGENRLKMLDERIAWKRQEEENASVIYQFGIFEFLCKF